MNILYGIQLNGNGHITRSIEIIRELRKRGYNVDILVSGENSSIEIEHKFSFRGLKLINNQRGGINWIKTILKINPIRLIIDINSINLSDYILVISDFEPISTISAKINNIKSISISNQNTLINEKIGILQRIFINMLSKCTHRIGIDYFKSVDTIQPIIQSDILFEVSEVSDKIVIYLPSYNIKDIISVINETSESFIIYSNEFIKTNSDNIEIKKIDRDFFINDIRMCRGVITASGFSTTSEALVLGKKLWSIPIKGQIEQRINSNKLSDLGIYTGDFNKRNIINWIDNYSAVDYEWENPIDSLIEKIINIYNES